ncbi:hypothetical protein [Streptomyces tailanensis]|nr:hypothetical protein [Streptomyces tailanensis]
MTAPRSGEDVPAQLLTLATRELVPPLDPVFAVRTIGVGRTDRQAEG